jgi:two-component system, chemotaxis family, response regulator WspF
MRIAIVHNNFNTIRLFEFLIEELGFDVCWTSTTAQDALLQHAIDCPDLLLVQLELTDMKGSELIKEIMSSTSSTIIAISDSVKNNPGSVFEAMSAGALDAFSEPSTRNPESIADLKSKIINIKKLHDSANKPKRSVIKQQKPENTLIAIGSSTGGPAALLTVLKKLPTNSNAIFVIIQHMDNDFSQGMADWLNEQTDIHVQIAKNHTIPEAGHVYMAGTNDHLIINSAGLFQYTDEPKDYPYRPSVNAFFDSAVSHWPNKLIGVLLTGMGRDGANGLLSFFNRGMHTIAQNEASCAVYGMPKAACEIGAVVIELDINDIADEIIRKIN